MQMFEIPKAITNSKTRTATLPNVLEAMSDIGPSATVDVICQKMRLTSPDDKADVVDVLSLAFKDGIVTLHHANKGKRGRPRYEWRIASEEKC